MKWGVLIIHGFVTHRVASPQISTPPNGSCPSTSELDRSCALARPGWLSEAWVSACGLEGPQNGHLGKKNQPLLIFSILVFLMLYKALWGLEKLWIFIKAIHDRLYIRSWHSFSFWMWILQNLCSHQQINEYSACESLLMSIQYPWQSQPSVHMSAAAHCIAVQLGPGFSWTAWTITKTCKAILTQNHSKTIKNEHFLLLNTGNRMNVTIHIWLLSILVKLLILLTLFNNWFLQRTILMLCLANVSPLCQPRRAHKHTITHKRHFFRWSSSYI